MEKLSCCIFINLILSGIFTLLSLSFSADISLAAFPVSLCFSVLLFYFAFFRLIKKQDISKISTVRRFFQYEPFVYITSFVLQRAGIKEVPFAVDVISALVWIAVTVMSFVILHFLSEKRVFAFSPAWKEYHEKNHQEKPSGIKRIFVEIFEWVDALIQAVFTIILLNIFFFQLYEIPSESMVPAFLVKDRVVVFKTLAGPKFPLSQAGIPYIQNYDRGDIVVFRNPHYSNDRKSEVKTFMSQFLYMCSLTLIKTNTDENGELKADPLVKRITGVPGEQLMLVDGILYARTKDNPEFKKVEEDSLWAAWDLNALDSKTKSRIRDFPFYKDEFQNVLDVEEARRSLDLVKAFEECEQLAQKVRPYASGKDLREESSVIHFIYPGDYYEFSLFNNAEILKEKILYNDGGAQWFDSFMTNWAYQVAAEVFPEKDKTSLSSQDVKDALKTFQCNGNAQGNSLVGGNLYDDSCFRLNVMTKIVFGKLILRNIQLDEEQVPFASRNSDEVRKDCYEEAQLLCDYILRLDQRNMSIFPPNNENNCAVYIPEDNYFMMGDNRYNSLDMRHSYEQKLIKLTPYDDFSVKYSSNLAPQYVSKKSILGKASFRFWPFDRIGFTSKIKSE